MRVIVGRKGLYRMAASTSQMGRFETEFLAADRNLTALVSLLGRWIDRVPMFVSAVAPLSAVSSRLSCRCPCD